MRRHKIRVRKYRDSKRPHLKFVVNYREADKRTRTFFETKLEAETFALNRNIELQNSGNAIEQLQPFGKTISDAVQYYIAHLKATEKSCSVTQLVDELVAAKKADGASKRHVNDLRCRLSIFAKKFDGQLVSTITTKEIDQWLRSLNVAPITRNHYRVLLVLAYNFAVQQGYATDNPAKATAKAKESGGDIGILSVTQAARLLEIAAPDILPYIAIGLFAGLRRAEIERLDWSEIDFDSGLIEVKAKKSKTAQRRFATLQPNLREWLLPVRKHRDNVTPENFNKQFVQAREAAGITNWPDNALRHSFASYHLAHFKNAASTALELGHHDSRITFAHYRELVRPKEGERYWNIQPATTEKVVRLFGRT
jgi:integrase